MSKEEVLAAIDDAWRGFKSAVEPLTAAELTVTGVCGDWSAKDVIGHVASWEAALTRDLLSNDRAARLADAGSIDAFNHREARRKAVLSVRRIIIEMDATHRALRRALDDLPESCFAHGTEVRARIDSDTALHYLEHADQIRAR